MLNPKAEAWSQSYDFGIYSYNASIVLARAFFLKGEIIFVIKMHKAITCP
jgi:hypothetical protein